MKTLQSAVSAHAKARPDHPALICGDSAVSYAELHRRGWMTAHALAAAGVGEGSRVAHFARDSLMYYDLLLGCAILGAVLVPADWRLSASEVDHVLRDSGTALLFHDTSTMDRMAEVESALPELREIILLDPDGFAHWQAAHTDKITVPQTGRETPVLQLYTSGTAGEPKGVVLAQRTFFALGELLAGHGLDWIDWQPGDRSLVALPGSRIGGIWWATQGLVAGVTNVILPAWSGERAAREIHEHRITTTCVVPAMLERLLDEPRADIASLRKVVYGGGSLDEGLFARASSIVDVDLVQVYGPTESGIPAVCLPPAGHRRSRLAAAGRPFPGVGLRIVDEAGADLPAGTVGEVRVSSPAGLTEYWTAPERTADTVVDGWIRTGDAGFLDEDGYLFVLGPISDMITVGGEHVYPAEVEDAIRRHPDVADAAVVGAPDPGRGERVYAFIVAHNGNPPSGPELTAFLRGSLAGFKIPTAFEVVDAVPRTPVGRILRRIARDRLWSGVARKAG
jgi:long-chain acyl-CoA synthetase